MDCTDNFESDQVLWITKNWCMYKSALIQRRFCVMLYLIAVVGSNRTSCKIYLGSMGLYYCDDTGDFGFRHYVFSFLFKIGDNWGERLIHLHIWFSNAVTFSFFKVKSFQRRMNDVEEVARSLETLSMAENSYRTTMTSCRSSFSNGGSIPQLKPYTEMTVWWEI